MRRCYLICLAGVIAVLAPGATRGEPKTILLWPTGAPGARGNADGDKPSLTIYLPDQEKATGTAIVICPGGGYGHLAMDHEGHQVARWLNSFGVAGFICKYRHSRSGAGYRHPIPLLDAQRAIRTVRSKARQWSVNPSRIGILGFSAGGHLTSTAGTHFDPGNPDAADPINRASCRPDFMVLVYPVVSLNQPWTHKGSRKNLLGSDPDPKLVESLSNETQVTAQTPPAFLVHTWEDTAVPAENSIHFYLALRKAKVPAEMHVYLKGPHGFGLGREGFAASSWPTRCEAWMQAQGLLK